MTSTEKGPLNDLSAVVTREDKLGFIEEGIDAATKLNVQFEDNSSLTGTSTSTSTDGTTASDLSESHQQLLWGIDDNPPWYENIVLGFQHFLALYMTALSIPLVLAQGICMGEDNVGKTELFGTQVFVCGISTVIQTLLGVRLPIVQSGTLSLLAPAMSYLSLPQNTCPIIGQPVLGEDGNFTTIIQGSPEHREIWQHRLTEIQGSIMVASLMEILLGSLGIIGFLLRFIGPLSIAPTIALLGLSLFKTAAAKASNHWWIAIFTLLLMVVFSQYLGNKKVPCAGYSARRKCHITWFPLFKLFPVILSVLFAWALCFTLTLSGVLPDQAGEWGYEARTDVKMYVIQESAWFRLPYPGQWGMPRVSLSLVLGLMAGIMASVIESVGDYYACANIVKVPKPPRYAINRGILVEGIGCMLGGLFGTGNGTTSNSVNIGIIGLTKVASRRVVVTAGILMMIFGTLSKVGSLFVTIPDPIIGALFFILFGMIVAVGIASLQAVDMHSSRNQFIFGFSFFFGMALPEWIIANPGSISTGVAEVDGICTVLLGTNMFVGGLVGFVLDNTIPGTLRERGIQREATSSDCENDSLVEAERQYQTYSIAFLTERLSRLGWIHLLPFCPGRKQVFHTQTGQNLK